MPFSAISRNFLVAILLIFCAVTATAVLNLYSVSLFLSSYPPIWVARYLTALTIINATTSHFSVAFLTKNIKRNALIAVGVVPLLLILMLIASFVSLYWLPFCISVLAAMTATFVSMMAWNIVPLAFTLREYKELLVYLVRASSLGGLVGSLQVLILIHFFSLESLLISLFVVVAGWGASVYLLPIIKDSKEAYQSKAPLIKYPLYTSMLAFFIAITAAKILVDYVFNYAVSSSIPKNEIAKFMAYFNWSVNFLGLLAAISASKRVMRLLHLSGILNITPVFMMLTSIASLFIPSIWAITTLASSKVLFFFNYTRIGLEIGLNVLPFSVSIAAKSRLKSMVSPLVELTVLLILLAFAHYIHQSTLLIVIATLSLLAIYFSRRVDACYQNTLRQEVEFKRFSIVNEFTPANEEAFYNTLSKVLSSKDDGEVLFALSLVDKLALAQLPIIFYDLINHSDPLIRSAVINIIQHRGERSSVPPLLERLEIEKDQGIRFQLFSALIALDPDALRVTAKKIVKDQSDPFAPLAIGILMDPLDHLVYSFEVAELRNISRDSDPIRRKAVAYAIGSFKIDELELNLHDLIFDGDHEVSIVAMQAAARGNYISLIDSIIAQLQIRPRVQSASAALKEMGACTIPFLFKQMSHPSITQQIIKVIAEIPGKESERVLLKLDYEGSILLKIKIAKEVNYRACSLAISDYFRHAAVQIALQEAQHIAYLEGLLREYPALFIAKEIISRINLAKVRILLWVAVVVDQPAFVNECMPSLLRPTSTAAYDKAVELLEICITYHPLQSAIISVFEKQIDQDLKHSIGTATYPDPWLDRVLKFSQSNNSSENMDKLLRVFELRSIDLFKDLPGEILFAIAEEAKAVSFHEGDWIFQENDAPNGLYCIISGEVSVMRHNLVMANLKKHDFFGELGLLDNEPRAATVVAASECSLLLLEKNTFDRLTDDQPEVLRVMCRAILKYLRANLKISDLEKKLKSMQKMEISQQISLTRFPV